MSQTAAGATIPEVTHHTATLNGDELHYVTAGDRRHPRPARARVPGELVGVSQAHPAARQRASRHRRRPSRLRRLRSRARTTTRAPSQRKACGSLSSI